MKIIIKSFLLILALQAENIDNDLAYKLVSEKLNGEISDEFVRAAFLHEKVEIHKEIAGKFAKPYEKKPWSDYRKIFVKESRVSAGEKFYNNNKDLIVKVAKEYAVDPFIIVTIAGVESNYGIHHSQYSVFNSLYSQIHDIPRRSKWATRELAEFLKYCYKDKLGTQEIGGSYAGAFGFGQFIPSSFTRYSVDFDKNGIREPYSWPDVLGSIANYLRMNGYGANSKNYSKEGDIYKAVFAYNHADNYVMAVLELTEKIRYRVTGKKRKSLDYSQEFKNFNDAFKKAREELGPSATFIWNKKRFSTQTSE